MHFFTLSISIWDFAFLPDSIYAQIIKLDSLKKVLVKEAIDSVTGKKYLALAENKLYSNDTTARIAIMEIQIPQIQQQREEWSKKSLQAKADKQEIKLANTGKEFKEKQLSNQRIIRNYLSGRSALPGVLAFILFRNIISKKKAYIQLQSKSEQIKELAFELGKQAKQIAPFQNQLSPHFVYNALHKIQGTCTK